MVVRLAICSGERTSCLPVAFFSALVPTAVMVRSSASRGVRTESTNVWASSSVIAGFAVPLARAMASCPRGQSALRDFTEASTSRPVPVAPGVTTGVVPSRVTTASAVPVASVSSRSLRAAVSASVSTVVTASTSLPLRRLMSVTGLRVGPTRRSTLASASTATPESAGTSVSVESLTVRMTGYVRAAPTWSSTA